MTSNVFVDNLLVIGPSWLGDMIMAQALFKVIKNKYTCNIDVLAPKWSLPIVKRMPEINTCIELPLTHGDWKVSTRYNIAKKLREKNYQQAIVLPNSWKSALIPFLAKIPKRTGYVGEFRYGLLNDVRKLKKNYSQKMVELYVALGYSAHESVSTYPIPSLIQSSDNLQRLVNQYQLNFDKPIIALCPGAEFGPAKCWPTEYYAELAKLCIQSGFQVWLFGSIKEKHEGLIIQEKTSNQCINFIGQTMLEDVVDLFSKVTMVVCNDSGLMHLASAAGTSLIAIYGATDFKFTPPLTPNAQMVSRNLHCQPCHKRMCQYKHYECLKSITANEIFQMLMRHVS